MNDNFAELILTLQLPLSTNDNLWKIKTILHNKNSQQDASSFISDCYQSILKLECWIWQLFSSNDQQWIEQIDYIELCETLALFNRNLIFCYHAIDVEIKACLLIPEKIEWINQIFEHLAAITDQNHRFICLVNDWFDNLAFFIHENPEYESNTLISYMIHRIASNYIMTEQYKIYLNITQQSLSSTVYTNQHIFYIKTCSLLLSSYLFAKAQDFKYTAEEIIRQLGRDYAQIIIFHTTTINSWSPELLRCISGLIHLFSSCCWWGGEKGNQAKAIFSNESSVCSYIDALIRIIEYKPLYPCITNHLVNDQRMLLDSTLFALVNIAQNPDFIWYLRSKQSLPDTLMLITETSICDRVALGIYVVLGEILNNDRLKELQISDSVSIFFFNILQHAWEHPSKKFKQVPIFHLLKGFGSLSKIDAIQQKTAETHKIELFIAMADQYPIIYDIIWALSFNQEIQQQLRLNTSFMTKLAHLPKHCDNELIQKTIQGILWNLESNHGERRQSCYGTEDRFDLMISYSHKDEIICRQIYDELIKAGYRVWIDFDQMHGNVMDAMAQAIEQSNMILICMSEQYRRSNYCRAEAHYAFQRQLKIVPVLLQEHYQPDGWLLFLVGQLLYVDFTKYEFSQAIEMLIREVKAPIIIDIGLSSVCSKEEVNNYLSMTSMISQFGSISTNPDNILEWTERHVQDWLITHGLLQMSHLFANFNGQSLFYMNEMIEKGDLQQIISLLQEDCIRKTNQSLSLVELAHFRALFNQYKSSSKKDTLKKLKKKSFLRCLIM